MSFSNPVSAKRYSVKKKSKSELKGLETLILYVMSFSFPSPKFYFLEPF